MSGVLPVFRAVALSAILVGCGQVGQVLGTSEEDPADTDPTGSPGNDPTPVPTDDPPVDTTDYACTEIIGFSQTLMWAETAGFNAQIDDAKWQIRWRASGDTELWGDPNADGWSPLVDADCLGHGPTPVLCTPCSQQTDSPDRVIFTITLRRYESDVNVWIGAIRTAIATIRTKFPGVKSIVLQPVVGGPNNSWCDHPDNAQGVRASFNHPYIDQAIAAVLPDAADLRAGISPEVSACSDYDDAVGHFIDDDSVRDVIGERIGLFYK